MKNIIILEKTMKKKKLSEDFVDKIASAEVAQASNLVDLVLKYGWVISNADMN